MRACSRILGAIAAVTAACSLTACGGSSAENPTKQPGKKISMSLIVGNQDPYYQSMICAARKAASDSNVDLDVQIPQQFDPASQIPLVSGVQAKNPDVLAIVPTDRSALVPPLLQVRAGGTKVITVDTSLNPAGASKVAVSQIGSDNVAGGQAAAKDLIKRIGTGKVLVISTQPGVSTLDQRTQGFQEVIASTPGIGSLGVQYSNNDASKASSIVTATIGAHRDLKGIFAANLASAQGAANGLRSAGMAGKVTVVGFDASPPQVEQLQQGLVASLVVQKPADMGRLAVEQAVAAATGKPVTPTISTGLVVATKENLDDPAIKPYVTPGVC